MQGESLGFRGVVYIFTIFSRNLYLKEHIENLNVKIINPLETPNIIMILKKLLNENKPVKILVDNITYLLLINHSIISKLINALQEKNNITFEVITIFPL